MGLPIASMSVHPSQSTPAGCVAGFFGLLSLGVSGLSGYAAWLRFTATPEIQGSRAGHTALLVACCLVALLVGGLLLKLGLRWALAVGPYDTRDPKEPRMKW
jgi:hypothetical protein